MNRSLLLNTRATEIKKNIQNVFFPCLTFVFHISLQILERENKRERILEARMREMRLRMRQDRDGAQQVTETDHTANDRDLEEATAEYMQTISELQAQQKTT